MPVEGNRDVGVYLWVSTPIATFFASACCAMLFMAGPMLNEPCLQG